MINGTPGKLDVASLPEVHASVSTSQVSLWRRMFAFAGPAYLVSVGYMDPGNWATDLEGGARFGYQLLWVLLMSNLMAILLQTLSARLGIVAGRDLAQACREAYPKPISYALWILCEIAIAACDLAEVLGAAIGLNLLFGLPLLAGVILTAADTLLILWFTRFGIRVIEAFILALVTIIGACFAIEIFLAKPDLGEIVGGLVPRLTGESLYVAIGILGATVMPHNLYLHSALVQTRRIGASEAEKRSACRFNLVDSVIALNGALFVNAAILILAATVFFKRGLVVTEIQQAHLLLAPLLGTTMAGVLFAVALLCAGQSSTLTGTMAGQIVMEGFLNFRMRPWLRRLITRMVAVVPAAITIVYTGENGAYRLLILSQVILSMQLPFAVIPLIQFTGDRKRMGAFANPGWVRLLAWTTALIIVGLNISLVISVVGEWVEAAGDYRGLVLLLVVPLLIGLLGLLAWVCLERFLPASLRKGGKSGIELPVGVATDLKAPVYQRILVPLDHTDRDRQAIAHAAALAKTHGAKLFLLHVEEGVTSQVYGHAASTAEVEAGLQYLNGIVEALRTQGVEAEAVIRHSDTPRDEIVGLAKAIRPDLLVMGAHGHSGIKDLIFGATINAVRHEVEAPILVVRDPGPEGRRP
ncbi:MAG TPA: Nramp family divalent metal transporter [Bryobacteraceae bacterium]|nr:Nramp family divalent metal transporter [Bryobacteraceae bacterium]